MNKNIVFLSVILVASLVGCTANIPSSTTAPSGVIIPLSGPIDTKQAELSGLAWIGDTLVLLPQYPERFGSGEGVLFAIPKQAILDYLDGKSKAPISPSPIKFNAPGLKKQIKNYEGFEAIGFLNQRVYLTIESGKNNKMMGYLVSGTISSDLAEIKLDTAHLVEIQPPIQMDNRTDEALVITQNKILTFFEINGAALNPKPAAHVFNLDLTPEGTISFPSLEYRVTDAALDPNGDIWVVNKVAVKEAEIFPTSDPLAEKYNSGNVPGQFQLVERLVRLNFDAAEITLADAPPIQIKLDQNQHNWEGLALLDNRGFLLVTDKSPDTILAFIPMP
jgi:hypothetical protein